jgi:hypothetical protein
MANGTINLEQTIFKAISSKVKTSLTQAMMTAERTLGNNSFAVAGFGGEYGGYFAYQRVSDKNSLNQSFRNADIGILIVVMLLFGFYPQFIIINQSRTKVFVITCSLSYFLRCYRRLAKEQSH